MVEDHPHVAVDDHNAPRCIAAQTAVSGFVLYGLLLHIIDEESAVGGGYPEVTVVEAESGGIADGGVEFGDNSVLVADESLPFGVQVDGAVGGGREGVDHSEVGTHLFGFSSGCHFRHSDAGANPFGVIGGMPHGMYFRVGRQSACTTDGHQMAQGDGVEVHLIHDDDGVCAHGRHAVVVKLPHVAAEISDLPAVWDDEGVGLDGRLTGAVAVAVVGEQVVVGECPDRVARACLDGIHRPDLQLLVTCGADGVVVLVKHIESAFGTYPESVGLVFAE